MAKQRNDIDKKKMNKLPYIVAVDFDGTLVEDCFPEIGKLNQRLLDNILLWKKEGKKIVLHTCRDGEQLEAAVSFCESVGLVFDAVNKNIPEVIAMFNNDTRKVYANVYIDDKGLSPQVPTSLPYYDPEIDFQPWECPPDYRSLKAQCR